MSNTPLTAKELIRALADNGVLSIYDDRNENEWYVEDCESYCGYAYITFNEKGEVIKVRGEE